MVRKRKAPAKISNQFVYKRAKINETSIEKEIVKHIK